jgi:hypothetical protein
LLKTLNYFFGIFKIAQASTQSMPLRLSDVELTAVMNACGPLSPAMRDDLLQRDCERAHAMRRDWTRLAASSARWDATRILLRA